MEVEKYVARDTGKLVLSSTFFLIPLVSTIQKGTHFYTAMLILTWGISTNYWRKATYGWRRDLDLIFSKVSFAVFFVRGYVVVYTSPSNTVCERVYIYTGFTFLGLIIYFYYCSTQAYRAGSPLWIYYHMLFHLFIGLEFMAIL
jgi:hypothetical protein